MPEVPLGLIRVLLVDDDERLARLTAEYMGGHECSVAIASDGEMALKLFHPGQFDIVVLDLMLPKLGGLEVCRQLRRYSDIPVLMLTARGEESDRVLGLESGADDYLPKPFSARELVARVRAHVRRARGKAGPAGRVLEVGALRIDIPGRTAVLEGQVLQLTSTEFDILAALADRAGRILSREQILDQVHSSAEDAFDRSIDVHISRLRQKLKDDPRQPQLLKTVRGAGYLLATAARHGE